jgi:hypothetical protein
MKKHRDEGRKSVRAGGEGLASGIELILWRRSFFANGEENSGNKRRGSGKRWNMLSPDTIII